MKTKRIVSFFILGLTLTTVSAETTQDVCKKIFRTTEECGYVRKGVKIPISGSTSYAADMYVQFPDKPCENRAFTVQVIPTFISGARKKIIFHTSTTDEELSWFVDQTKKGKNITFKENKNCFLDSRYEKCHGALTNYILLLEVPTWQLDEKPITSDEGIRLSKNDQYNALICGAAILKAFDELLMGACSTD